MRFLCLPLAAVAAVSLASAQGRTPIFQPTVISAPGHYLVTRDITAPSSPGDGVIRITSPDVVLDLNGHTVATPGNAAIYIAPPLSTPGSIEIRNGQLRGGVMGITHPNDTPGTYAVRLRFERLDIAAVDFALLVHGAPVVEVVSCTFRGPATQTAVQILKAHLPSWTGLFTDNRVVNVARNGLELTGMSGGLVRDNVVSGFGASAVQAAGITLTTSEGVRVQGNSIHCDTSSTVTSGLQLWDDTHRILVTDNVITANLDGGLYVGGSGNIVTGNLVGGTTFDGVVLIGNDNTLTRNTVQSGGGSGVRVSGRNNLIDGNTIEGHAGVGLTFVAGALNNAYRANILRNNSGGAVSGSATDAGGNIP